jgi:hypothetical protein
MLLLPLLLLPLPLFPVLLLPLLLLPSMGGKGRGWGRGRLAPVSLPLWLLLPRRLFLTLLLLLLLLPCWAPSPCKLGLPRPPPPGTPLLNQLMSCSPNAVEPGALTAAKSIIARSICKHAVIVLRSTLSCNWLVTACCAPALCCTVVASTPGAAAAPTYKHSTSQIAPTW